MSATWSIFPATDEDVAAIGALLRNNALPDNDLASNVGDFFVARSADAVIGAAGLERYGAHALLRSVVVDAAWRRGGIAGALIDAVLRHARTAGLRDAYLLTNDAASYFTRHGFARIERDALPEGVRDSAQALRLCPLSARAMVRPL